MNEKHLNSQIIKSQVKKHTILWH